MEIDGSCGRSGGLAGRRESAVRYLSLGLDDFCTYGKSRTAMENTPLIGVTPNWKHGLVGSATLSDHLHPTNGTRSPQCARIE
ncbi:hypothetical protein BaRGS_00001688 [Batillaria attramentaria]|uniref:Uncharacterized protein n=1 Tax=Batillaria attramentaria TaxID=370345 RepID=A0ABD0M5C5_9CAEN